MQRSTLTLMLLVITTALAQSTGQPIPKRLLSNHECGSENVDLGHVNSLQECAAACAAKVGCNYFSSGKDARAGQCNQELADNSGCLKGYLYDDGFDFYQLQIEGLAGCMEEGSINYKPRATVTDDSCVGVAPCAHYDPNIVDDPTKPCPNCLTDGHGCTKDDSNDGFRNPLHDTIYASRVDANTLVIDGDLRDWEGHTPDWCYKDVAFAKSNGDEVIFESFSGGKWFGPDDFSLKFMLSWDDDYLYLAAEVTDDVLQVGEEGQCYANGLQAAFEVGGPKSSEGEGMLQALRSKDLGESRLQLINLGLKNMQVQGAGAACSTEVIEPNDCCVHYELSQQQGGFARKTRAAVLRNPMTKVTTFEVGFAVVDLLGDDEERKSKWAQGLQFGFSFLVNDGDTSTDQQGWAGYYPHSIVFGWNEGQKQPSKVGVLQLDGYDSDGCGSCTGWIFFGTFILAPLFTAAAFFGRYAWRRYKGTGGGGGFGFTRGGRSQTNPLASADTMANITPALTIATPPPVSSNA